MPKRNDTQPDISAGTALGVLFDETVSLYFRLTADAAMIHGQGTLSGPRRTVLASLARSGPLTVAQMARARGQSRQRFQPLVNRLLAEGLVEANSNPRHKASPLIALTVRGKAEVRRSLEREAALRERLIVASPAKMLLQAAARSPRGPRGIGGAVARDACRRARSAQDGLKDLPRRLV